MSIINNSNIILLEDLDKELNFKQIYYCANIKEKTFICSTRLTYVKRGGFGMNYRYCNSCYDKWNKLEANEQVNKYYGTKGKANQDVTDPFDDD